MPPEILEFAREFGLPATITFLLALGLFFLGMAVARRMNTTSKQDDTITNLLTEINAERKSDRLAAEAREKERQQSINHLSAELTELKSKQAYEAGRNTEIKETMQREREDWKAERAANAGIVREYGARIQELERKWSDSQEQIKQLNTQIETLKQRIADKDGEIVSLKAALLQLETEKSQLLALNTELRKQVTEQQARIDNLSMLNQLKQEAAEPVTPPTSLPDATIAIPDMQDVDETVITEPQTVTTGNTETEEDDAA